MELKLDLHIHSAASADGRMPLREIVCRCREAGLHGAAICDHDRVLEETVNIPDFLCIPGVEISTEYGHLLGLFVTQPIETNDFFAAAEAIRAAGGITVLAHPFARSTDAERLLPILPLLDGVEVFNSRAERKNPRANAQAKEFAEVHGLRFFAGSDAHLPEEIGGAVLTVEAEAPTCAAVKAALLAGKVSVTGRRSPARYTAMSQLTRHRKQGASPAVYAKWALFALKCCMQDILHRGD